MAEIGVAGIKNTDTEIRDGVWADSTKANGADIAAIKTESESHPTLTEIEASTVLAKHADTKYLATVAMTGSELAGSIARLIHDNLNAAVGSIPTNPTLQTVWTDEKAGFLTGDAFVRLGAPAGASVSEDIATVDANVDAIKAKTDKLAGGTSQGTASAGTSTPTNIVELTITAKRKIYAIWLDLSNLTANATIKLYYKIDGTTYREFDKLEWTTSDEDGVYFNKSLVFEHDMKVEITGGEAAGVNIPYEVHYSDAI